MRLMLKKIGPRTVLLWFSEEELNDEHWATRQAQLQVDPLFITLSMLEELRPMVQDVVVVNPSEQALATGTDGMKFPESQGDVASEMLGCASHVEVGSKLIPSLREHLYKIA